MVFQSANASLNPLIRVGDQIADVVQEHEGASPADAHARAVEMLRAMGLADPARNARAYPHQYSGGMAQRALLAMALACRPRVLLADEPTTGLDPVIQEQVLERIVAHVEEQSALVADIEKLFRGSECVDGKARGSEEPAHRAHDVLVVIDHTDPQFSDAHGLSRAMAAGAVARRSLAGKLDSGRPESRSVAGPVDMGLWSYAGPARRPGPLPATFSGA